jgi:hypothetical protein
LAACTPCDTIKFEFITLGHRCLVHSESALRGRTSTAIIPDVQRQVALDIGKIE